MHPALIFISKLRHFKDYLLWALPTKGLQNKAGPFLLQVLGKALSTQYDQPVLRLVAGGYSLGLGHFPVLAVQSFYDICRIHDTPDIIWKLEERTYIRNFIIMYHFYLRLCILFPITLYFISAPPIAKVSIFTVLYPLCS